MAYDVSGTQRFVLRGSVGVYHDRPRPGDAQALAAITGESVTVRYSQLQTLGSGGLTTQGASQITAYEVRGQAAPDHDLECGHADDAAVVDVVRRGLHRASRP